MLGGRARSALAPSRVGGRYSDRRQIPRAASSQRASQAMIGAARIVLNLERFAVCPNEAADDMYMEFYEENSDTPIARMNCCFGCKVAK